MSGKKIGTGRTAEVYEWSDNRLIKLFYPGASQEEVNREYEIQSLLQQELPFLAEVYGLEKVGERIGILYERVQGDSLSREIMKKPEKVFAYGQLMGRIQQDIHQVTLSSLPPFRKSISGIIRSSAYLLEKEKEVLLQILSHLPEGEAVCHMDYHPENIYVSGDHVTVLDWMTAGKGHPFADVARTRMILKYALLPEASKEERLRMDRARKELLRGHQKGYFPQGMNREETKQMKAWETVLLAARLSEHLSEAEKAMILKVLSSRLEEILTP